MIFWKDRPHRRLWMWTVPLLLLATWLGARGLGADAIWYDEYWSIYYAGGAHYGPIPLAETWARVAATEHELNPPGYYLLLNGWGTLVGWTPYAGRALSLLFGLLAVAWTYRLGRDMFSPLAGLGAAVALGAGAFFADYLHEMRAYTLYALLTAIAVWAYWRVIRGRGGRGTYVALGGSTIGLLYTHYYAALVPGALALYHLVFARGAERWWQVVALWGAVGAAYLPWLREALATLPQATGAGRQVGAMSAAVALETLFYTFSNGSIALLAVLAAYGAPRRKRGEWLVWFLAGAILVAILVVNAVLRVFTHVRYAMMLWPLLAAVVGLGVANLARRGVRPVFVLGIWIAAGVWNTLDPAFILGVHGTFRHLPYDTLAETLAAHAQPDDVVVFHAPDFNWIQEPVFDYYMHGLPVRHTLMEALPGRQEDDEYFRSARRFIGEAPRVWVAVEKDLPPNFRLGEFERALAVDYVHCATVFDLPDMRLDLYARVADEMPLRFGEGVELALLEPLAPETDETLTVLLGSSVQEGFPAGAYSIGLHVVDASGALVAQADYGLPAEPFACRWTEIAVGGLSPGEYALLAMVYNWGDGTRLTGSASASGETGDRLALGSFGVR